MKAVLIVGHEGFPPLDGGVVNEAAGVSEYQFFRPMVPEIIAAAKTRIIHLERMPEGYSHLPKKVNKEEPDFVIEMHANGGPAAATGTEVVYWKGSALGKHLGSILVEEFEAALELKIRRGDGLKAVHGRLLGGRWKNDSPEDRGSMLLGLTKAPAVLGEPFFLSSNADYARACARKKELVLAYARAIDRFAQYLSR